MSKRITKHMLDQEFSVEDVGSLVLPTEDPTLFDIVLIFADNPVFDALKAISIGYIGDNQRFCFTTLLALVRERKNVIVCDLDGCCIFSEHRIPFLLEGDAETYHDNHIYDHPIPQGVEVYRKFLSDPLYRVMFVTGRVQRAREYTMKQLHQWVSPHITHKQLLMRPTGTTDDELHDTVLKPKLLFDAGISLNEIFLVFEDRNSVVEMWRRRGVVCYQTAFGPF